MAEWEKISLLNSIPLKKKTRIPQTSFYVHNILNPFSETNISFLLYRI